MEDTNDTRNDYYVGPVYGGQNFDAEFIAANSVNSGTSSAKLFVAIGSGQRTNNGFTVFEPGDIQMVTQNTQTGKWSIYGIEVGGGGSAGKTYNLDGSGYVSSVTTLNNGQLAGTLWLTKSGLADYSEVQSSTDGWRSGYGSGMGFDPYKRVQLDNSSSTSTKVGSVEFDFDAAPSTGGEHSWIEAGIDLSLLPGEQVKYIGWAPSCANDHSYMEVDLSAHTGGIPEPASLVIWSLFGGAAGIGALRRRRQG